MIKISESLMESRVIRGGNLVVLSVNDARQLVPPRRSGLFHRDGFQCPGKQVSSALQIFFTAFIRDRDELFLAAFKVEDAETVVIDRERNVHVMLEAAPVHQLRHIVVREGLSLALASGMLTFEPEEKAALRVVY